MTGRAPVQGDTCHPPVLALVSFSLQHFLGLSWSLPKWPLLKVLAQALLERLSIWVVCFWPDAVMIIATCGMAYDAMMAYDDLSCWWWWRLGSFQMASARLLLCEVAFLLFAVFRGKIL